jgi:hypothetical protein
LPISMDGSNISLEGPVIRWMSAMDYARPRDAPGRWA